MLHSREIHPDSNCYNPFSQFLAHNYNDWKTGKESVLAFPEDQKLSLSLAHSTKIDEEDEGEFYHFATGIENEKVEFTYKGETFKVKIDVRNLTLARQLRDDKHYVYFVVTFDNSDTFQDLSKVAKKWSTEYFDNMVRKTNKILIFINDESWFRRLTKKEKRSLDTVLLPEKDKNKLVTKIKDFLKPETRELYKRLGKNYKLIVLLHGLPGTGKTSFIHAIASELGRDIAVYAHDKKNGDTEFTKLMRTVGKKILCLEDMDCLFNTRDTEDKHGITFSGIINALDGFLSPQEDDNYPFICFITTNFIERLDKTLIRPGRVDYFLEFFEIKKAERRKMFINYFGEDLADDFEEKFSALRTKVTPATLDMYLFGHIGDAEAAIENISDIKKLKEITTSSGNGGMFS